MKGRLYVITNTVNGKQYVGKTYNTVEERFKEHLSDSAKAAYQHRPLYRAINKYGADKFTVKEVGVYPKGELEDKEIELVATLNTYKAGYNATVGGDGRPYLDLPKERLAEAIDKTDNVTDAAKLLDVATHTVKRYAKNYGLEVKKPKQVGEKAPRASITEEAAIAIKYGKESIKEACERYKVSRHVVSKIRNNVTWKHI